MLIPDRLCFFSMCASTSTSVFVLVLVFSRYWLCLESHTYSKMFIGGLNWDTTDGTKYIRLSSTNIVVLK